MMKNGEKLSKNGNSPEKDTSGGKRQYPVPPYNEELDPDNAVSPNPFEERAEEGERKFYPEGGPEDPPVEFPRGYPKNR